MLECKVCGCKFNAIVEKHYVARDNGKTGDKAQNCVCGQRENEYGSPEDNFKTIADFWSVYKGVEFTANDVAMMMALLKIARIRTGTATDDSYVDLAGYAACGAEINSKTK